MNDKRIQQVLEIEQRAQEIYNEAVNKAKQLPIQAEAEEKIHHAEAIAAGNMNRAVTDVLSRVAGKE